VAAGERSPGSREKKSDRHEKKEREYATSWYYRHCRGEEKEKAYSTAGKGSSVTPALLKEGSGGISCEKGRSWREKEEELLFGVENMGKESRCHLPWGEWN